MRRPRSEDHNEPGDWSSRLGQLADAPAMRRPAVEDEIAIEEGEPESLSRRRPTTQPDTLGPSQYPQASLAGMLRRPRRRTATFSPPRASAWTRAPLSRLPPLGSTERMTLLGPGSSSPRGPGDDEVARPSSAEPDRSYRALAGDSDARGRTAG